ncbi:MAG: hypothetical protein OXN24_02140 [Candidatus Dadabacteria bacterium]|nr:hypothetical protein [Candidatus Dadabacteria bacterium]
MDLVDDGTAAKLLRKQDPAALAALGTAAAARYRENIEAAGLEETGQLLGSLGYTVHPDGAPDEEAEKAAVVHRVSGE